MLRPNQHPWALQENKYYMIFLAAAGILIAAEYCLNCRKYSHG